MKPSRSILSTLSSLVFSALIVFVLAAGASAQSLLVSSNGSARVDQFNSSTGALIGTFASGNGLAGIHGVAFGPDHQVYVASGDSGGVIKRFHGRTGAFLGDFTGAGSGLNNPIGLAFAPDGRLWVTSAGNHSLRRFSTAGVLELSVTAGSLSTPIGLTLGPDNLLYVCSAGNNSIKRYNSTTGAFVDTFVTNVSTPQDVTFGADGNLYISSYLDAKVYKYSGLTGAKIGIFADSIGTPYGLTFGPDGNLYICSNGGFVKRCNGSTGAFIDNFATMGGATMLTFVPAYNAAPVANNDSPVSHSVPVDIDVAANDTDLDLDFLSVSILTSPTHGTASMNADNTVHYVPDNAFVGTDTFTYSIDDGFGGTSSATVTVTVTPPSPVIASLDPNPAERKSAFTLRVLGSNFTNNSVVRWAGANRPTTFVNSGELQIQVSKIDTANEGGVLISVNDPEPAGGGVSNNVTLDILAPRGALTIQSVLINGNTVTAVFKVANTGQLPISNVTLVDATIMNFITGFIYDGTPIPNLFTASLAPGDSATATVTFTDPGLVPGLMATLFGEARFYTAYNSYRLRITNTALLVGLVKSVTVAPNTVLGGATPTGTVKLNAPAPAGGLTVNLASTNAAASVPANVLVAAGTTSATFTVTTVPTATQKIGNITAAAAGIKVAARLTVKPSQIVSISFSPSTVKSGFTTTGTVTLNNPAPASYTVTLSSDNPAKLSVPASVTFVAGATTATFTATAGATAANTIVTVSGQDPSGVVTSKAITVKP
jgi:WD40 repeat protein